MMLLVCSEILEDFIAQSDLSLDLCK